MGQLLPTVNHLLFQHQKLLLHLQQDILGIVLLRQTQQTQQQMLHGQSLVDKQTVLQTLHSQHPLVLVPLLEGTQHSL